MEALIAGAVVALICIAGVYTLFKAALPASYDEGYHYGMSMVSHPADRAEAEAAANEGDGDFELGVRAALDDHLHGLPGDTLRDQE